MFITFEGIEGCGKSTQAKRIANRLERTGVSLILTREPGGTPIGHDIRQILLSSKNRDLPPLAELFLYEADRALHMAGVVKPALAEKKWVLCDRFFDATTAYQGYARGQDLHMTTHLNEIASFGITPDMTFLLDCPVSVGIKRALKRNAESEEVGQDRFEQEKTVFHEAVRHGYMDLAKKDPERFVVVDATQAENRLEEAIFSYLKAHIPSSRRSIRHFGGVGLSSSEQRPVFFSRIIGQEKAKRFLENVMARKRVPHAYLFTGISGIGKTSAAKAFTMRLNCSAPSGLDGCGVCPSCRKMLNGNFPDFISIEPDGQRIKIEQIRELNRSLGYAPFSGGYRVCVIHRAEAMTGEAANAFLKTLEEPPAGNIFVLNATDPRDLLPTIVSRCQRVSFMPLKAREITEQLNKETNLDGPSVSILARAADGSLGRALKMGESNYLERRQTWLKTLFELYGCSGAEAMNMAVESTKENRAGLDQPGNKKVGLFDMLSVWATCYRDLLLVRTGAPKSLLINEDFLGQLKETASRLSLQNLIESFQMVDRAVRDLYRMRNPTLVMENTLLNLQKMGQPNYGTIYG